MPPSYRLNPLTIIAPIYYMGILFGILPMSYTTRKKISYSNPVRFIGRKRENVPTGCFYASKNGMAMWTVQLVLQTWSFVRMSFYLAKTINQRTKVECSKGFYCPVFGSLLAHAVINPIVVSLALFRLPESVDVLNMTASLLTRYRYPRPWLMPNTYVVALLTVAPVVKSILVYVSTPQRYPDLYYPFSIAKFAPLTIVFLEGALCVVTQYSYEDINRELEEIYNVQSNHERAIRLTELMNDHWFLEDYMETMTDTFGLEMVLITMDIYIQFLLYLYMIIWQVVVRYDIVSNAVLYLSLLVELIVVLGQFVYMCYRCDASYNELRLFTLRVNSRKVKVTAFEFFDINLSFLFATAGGILVYFLVLVQFQLEGHDKMLETNSSNASVPEYCCSWPCLEVAFLPKNDTVPRYSNMNILYTV